MSPFIPRIGESGASGPAFATVLSGANILASVGVWTETIKGWAALTTVVLGVPTAICILCYWILKLRIQWKNRDSRREE